MLLNYLLTVRILVLEAGTLKMTGQAGALLNNRRLREAYLG